MPTLLHPRQSVAATRESPDEEHARRMLANLLAMIACLLLIGAGLFVVEGLHSAAKLEACFEAGRRVCPVSGPGTLYHAPVGLSPVILPGISGARP